MVPFLFCVFIYVSHGCSMASGISIFPTLSLIHLINEEIVLVDDQFYFTFVISISLLDIIICLMFCP